MSEFLTKTSDGTTFWRASFSGVPYNHPAYGRDWMFAIKENEYPHIVALEYWKTYTGLNTISISRIYQLKNIHVSHAETLERSRTENSR